MDSSDTAQIHFDDVRVPQRYRIGEEGMGFTYQMMQFQEERLWAGAKSVGVERMLKLTIDYLRDRKAFGKPLLDNQYIHYKIAELQTEIEAVRSLVYRATELYVAGNDVTQLASMLQTEGRANVARGGRLVRAVLGRHGLHGGDRGEPGLARHAPGFDRRRCRRDHDGHHRQDDGDHAEGLMNMFDTLLIANRGEIACRVIRTARAMGIRTVAVYSDADRDARHVRLADTAVGIGPGPARESYLDIDKIIAACHATGAQAVHPGYGFLSENADFARALRDAGLVFVGPPPEAIDALGNKSAAKRLAERIGVPCLPGYSGAEQDLDTLVQHAQRIGPPLMIKAAAGGGGRGMRRCDDVTDVAALRGLLEAARTEAIGSFGNGDLLLERLVEQARHVEMQVFGDSHGHYVHLGERDCSTQRRNQKVLEEAPAPGVTPALRAKMGAAAVKLAQEVGYRGAGTIEFLLSPDDSFSFLEMNTRLQVEHPVTEAITGLDLVEWQLRVAQGEPLPRTQDEIVFSGHAIEARLCAEDAFAGFVPQIGRVLAWRSPGGAGLRLDHGMVEQPEVPPFYDSMIAKVIAHGTDREQARHRLIGALAGTSILGLRTNRDYLLECLKAEPFVKPALATRWLGEVSGAWKAPEAGGKWLTAAAAIHLHRRAAAHGSFALWSNMGVRNVPLRVDVEGTRHLLRLVYASGAPTVVHVGTGVDTVPHPVTVMHDDGVDVELLMDGRHERVRAVATREGGWVDAFGVCAAFTDLADAPPDRTAGAGGGTVMCKMHGALVKLAVAPGQKVAKGEFLLAIEAMKMEHRIDAPVGGIVVEVGASAGTQVAPGRLLVRIEPDPA